MWVHRWNPITCRLDLVRIGRVAAHLLKPLSAAAIVGCVATPIIWHNHEGDNGHAIPGPDTERHDNLRGGAGADYRHGIPGRGTLNDFPRLPDMWGPGVFAGGWPGVALDWPQPAPIPAYVYAPAPLPPAPPPVLITPHAVAPVSAPGAFGWFTFAFGMLVYFRLVWGMGGSE